MAGHTAAAVLGKYPPFDLEDSTADVDTYIAKSIQPKTQTNAMEALGLMAAKKSSVPKLKGAPTDPMTAYVNAVKSSLA